MQLNLDDKGGARELAFHRIKAAREDLEPAQLNFENGQYRTSNNRAYYAIFRAISACLALEFKAYKQHAQEVRHASDYDDFYVVSVEDAREQMKTAEEVVNMVEKYLKET